jgi:hypothetical protein
MLIGRQLTFEEDLGSSVQLKLSNGQFEDNWASLVEVEPATAATVTPTPTPTPTATPEPIPPAVVFHLHNNALSGVAISGADVPYSLGPVDNSVTADSAALILAASSRDDLLVVGLPREVDATVALNVTEVTQSTSVWRRGRDGTYAMEATLSMNTSDVPGLGDTYTVLNWGVAAAVGSERAVVSGYVGDGYSPTPIIGLFGRTGIEWASLYLEWPNRLSTWEEASAVNYGQYR